MFSPEKKGKTVKKTFWSNKTIYLRTRVWFSLQNGKLIKTKQNLRKTTKIGEDFIVLHVAITPNNA